MARNGPALEAWRAVPADAAMSLRPSHLYPLFRPMLFALDPEIAHDVAFSSLDIAARCGVARMVLPSVPATRSR